MMRRLVQSLVLWFSICTLCLSGGFLVACGPKDGGASSALSLNLKIPSDYDTATFWLGVQSKNLVLASKDGETIDTIPWEERGMMKAEIHKGDIVRFEGRDANNTLLVFGQATVGEENTLSLPLQRAL